MMNESNIGEDIKRVEAFCSQIGEHFDSVRIIAVRKLDNSDSRVVSSGYGDIYSQLGAVREWMLIQDQRARNEANED